MHKKIKIFSIILSLLFYNSLIAQDEYRYEGDSTETFKEPDGNFHILKLRKSYVLGDGLSLRSANGGINITQTFQTLYGVNAANKNLTGLNSTFDINRARMTLVGNLFDNKISMVARVNLAANYQSVTTGKRTFNTTLQEAYIEYRPNRTHTFNFGLRADYVDSRETRIEGESLGFINRSAVSASFDAIFDYGIRYKGNYKLGGKHLLKPYLSITTGDSRSALQKNFGGFKYGIRIDYLPFDKFSKGGEFFMDDIFREEKPKLVIGVIYSYNDGATSAQGTNGGRYVYGDSMQNILLPKYSKFGVDYLFKYNGFYSMGSCFATKSFVPNNIKGEFRVSNGSFSTYSASQTEEQTQNLVQSRLNLGSGFNFQAGYIFPSDWAFGARYSSLNNDVVSANYADYNKYYTLVATKYLTGHNLKIQIEMGYDELKEALKTATQNGNYYTQVQFTVQF
ncbi:MAG: hypothetical protein NTZ59_01675 [Bacteroidetes bacterium]|nr:hypothetical protein [Bacteroidota bacterium]